MLAAGLAECRKIPGVVDVRVLGAIAVVELDCPVDMMDLPYQFVEQGVWVRPFGRLIYLMPPYVIDDADILTLTRAVSKIVQSL